MPFWNLIFKKKTIMFFWSKLSKLHKKDPILHVTTTVSLKQGETRTSKQWTHSTPVKHSPILCLPWMKPLAQWFIYSSSFASISMSLGIHVLSCYTILAECILAFLRLFLKPSPSVCSVMQKHVYGKGLLNQVFI